MSTNFKNQRFWKNFNKQPISFTNILALLQRSHNKLNVKASKKLKQYNFKVRNKMELGTNKGKKGKK